MSSYTHFSEDFHLLLDVWPKGYITFPSDEVRGLSVSKACITVENVNTKPVAFRIVNEQNSTLSLRVCPTHCVLLPGAIQRVEIINTTDHSCTISDRIYIEAIICDKDFSKTTSETISSIFTEKSVNYYCLKCYETNDLALIPMQEELFRVEQRLKAIEYALKTFSKWFIVRNYSYPFMLMLLLFCATLFSLWSYYSFNEWATCHCVIKHRMAAQTVVKRLISPKRRGKYDVTLYDQKEYFMSIMLKKSPRGLWKEFSNQKLISPKSK